MAADFKFLMEFGTQNTKEIDTVLANIRAVKSTLAEIKASGDLGKVMGTEDIDEARQALDKMAKSLKDMKSDGKELINAGEMAREVRHLSEDIQSASKDMDNLSDSSEKVESNMEDSTNQAKSFKKQVENTTKSMNLMENATNKISNSMKAITDKVKWKVTEGAIDSLETGLQTAYYFAKDLDRVMTEIRIVTGDSADEVENFVGQAGQLADSLGSSMVKFSEASVLFLQQGKSREDAIELAKQSVIAANITGASSREAAELMTASQEGFRRSAEEASNTLDIFARLGAETGSSFQEIATSLSKSASSFSAAGFSMESAASALATVSTVTRQSAEQIGTGFKTIIARLGSVKVGGEEGAQAISKIEDALKKVNGELGLAGEDMISIFGADGDIKNGQEILETIGNNWERIKDSTSQVTQNILLEAVAG